MKWLIAMIAGSLAGWLISTVTEGIAIAMASGAAIGVLTTVALFGNRPVLSFLKVAGAMAIGSLAGWLVASLTDAVAAAMVIGAAVGALATIAVYRVRPVLSLVKVVCAMGCGFLVGWGIGTSFGDHRLGVALAILFGVLLFVLVTEPEAELRRRPF
jgi:hypothetical protein